MEIRNLINSSINDEQLAGLSLREIRYSFFIFHKTVPDTSSKFCRNKIMEGSHCGCIQGLGSTKADKRKFLEKHLHDIEDLSIICLNNYRTLITIFFLISMIKDQSIDYILLMKQKVQQSEQPSHLNMQQLYYYSPYPQIAPLKLSHCL